MKKKLVWVLYACLLALPLQAFAGPCPGKSKDTERISGRMAVFYAPSQAQFNSLSQEDQEAYTELLSDFYEYTGRLGRFLDKHGIKHILTGSRYIEVKAGGKAYCYDKTKLEEELGVLLSDGKKQPKLVQGAFTDLEMMPTVVDYYSLK
ncbi:MAG: hypothetical protein Q8O79_04620 [Pseudomonadota bacterium]|nr:hypothetical protein [Pseudomonadota bacterium]